MAGNVIGSAVVEIRADSQKLKSDMENVKKEVQGSAKKMETDFKSLRLDIDTRLAKMNIGDVKKYYESLKVQMDQKLKFNTDSTSIEKTATAMDAARARMKELNSETKKGEAGHHSFIESLKHIGETILVTFGVEKIVEFFKEVAEQAAKFEEVEHFFQGSAMEMENLRNATKGTVSDMSLMKLSNQATDLGISMKEQPLLFAMAKRAAEAYGTDVATGFQKVTMATEGNIRGLRAVGVQKKVYEQIVKDLAKEHGGLITEMDAETQKTIGVQALIKATGMTMEEATAKERSHADAIEAATVKWENFKLKLGHGFVGIFAGIANAASALLGTLAQEKTVVQQTTEAGTKQKLHFDYLAETYLKLKGKINQTGLEHETYKKTIEELNTKYPEYFKNVNLEKDGYDKVSTAIGLARVQLDKYLESKIAEAALNQNIGGMGEAFAKQAEAAEKAYEIERKIEEARKSGTYNQSVYSESSVSQNGTLMQTKVGTVGGSLEEQLKLQERVVEESQKEYQLLLDKATAVKKLIAEKFKDAQAPIVDGGGGGGLTDEALAARAEKEKAILDKYHAAMLTNERVNLEKEFAYSDEATKREYDKLSATTKKKVDLQSWQASERKKIEETYTKDIITLIEQQASSNKLKGSNLDSLKIEKESFDNLYKTVSTEKLKEQVLSKILALKKEIADEELKQYKGTDTVLRGTTAENYFNRSNDAGDSASSKALYNRSHQKERLGQLKEDVKESDQSVKEFGQSLAGAFSQGIFAAEGLGGAFAELGKNFAGMIAQALAFKLIMLGLSAIPGVGGVLSWLKIGAHSGGDFVGTSSGVMKLAGGGSFIVPAGFPNDTFPLMVESGERVSVTPRSQVSNASNNFNDGNIVNEIKSLNARVSALANRPIVNKTYLDRRLVAESVTRTQTEFSRGNIKD
jgi:hypothetical protein